LKELLTNKFLFVDPALIVCFNVRPLWFQLIAEIPQELTLDSVIEDEASALSESLNIGI
jgi:hypothetical protein